MQKVMTVTIIRFLCSDASSCNTYIWWVQHYIFTKLSSVDEGVLEQPCGSCTCHKRVPTNSHQTLLTFAVMSDCLTMSQLVLSKCCKRIVCIGTFEDHSFFSMYKKKCCV
uniref:Secreted protein n=1 Tax=Pyxicephalus adspersus TaxID=30357 RepID=A0AAV3AEI4_PYXAD|nr:TPA: hypothetical protein GDO54_013806 [Pyxicephalus adspersus]